MENNEKITALSDIGLKRKNNEDIAYAIKNQYGSLLVVADGMGGHRKGEVASKIIVDTFSIAFLSIRKKFSTRRSKKFFKKYFKRANKEIYQLSLSEEEYREMGSTGVAALIGVDETVIVSCGDSRCYILGNDKLLKQVTKDQTYGQLLFDSGRISKSELQNQPQKNLLINAVGINADLTNVEEFILPNESYLSILLCSDGLYNMVSDEMIQQVLNTSGMTAVEKGKKLIELALQNGGNDNIAVVISEK